MLAYRNNSTANAGRNLSLKLSNEILECVTFFVDRECIFLYIWCILCLYYYMIFPQS